MIRRKKTRALLARAPFVIPFGRESWTIDWQRHSTNGKRFDEGTAIPEGQKAPFAFWLDPRLHFPCTTSMPFPSTW